MLTISALEFTPQSVASLKKERILVAEDDKTIREAITLALSDEGYEVVGVGDGQTILNVLQLSNLEIARSIDLLILDLMLPKVNGLDLCRSLRHQGNNLPILMISARGSEIDRVVGLETGADDYLAKPFGIRELIARCKALLRRSNHYALPTNQTRKILQTETEKVLHWKELSLYPESHRVTLRGQELALSPKEYCLLELFMKHPKRIWERDQLLEQVWGVDYIDDLQDSKTLEMHIRYLRKKLGDSATHPEYVKTVRGFGYCLG